MSACGTVDEDTIARLELSPADEEAIRSPQFCGGSVVVAPDSQVIAGPLGNEEGILYADLDLEIGVKMKLRHDFAGHYNRPDIFQVRINADAPQIFGGPDLMAGLADQGGPVLGTRFAAPGYDRPAFGVRSNGGPRELGAAAPDPAQPDGADGAAGR